jgi:putative N-acetylmannosamine-6-phosphate epimerase
LAAGADAVVVGTAITNLPWAVSRFVQALKPKSSPS